MIVNIQLYDEDDYVQIIDNQFIKSQQFVPLNVYENFSKVSISSTLLIILYSKPSF